MLKFLQRLLLISLAHNFALSDPLPIKIIVNNWQHQILNAKITGEIFKAIGYRIEYVTIDDRNQLGGLSRGLYHVQVALDEEGAGKPFYRMLQSGSIIDLGSNGMKIRGGMWYPFHVELLCPGLPDWKSLNNCSHFFSNSETYPEGEYLTGRWDIHAQARIRALGLNYTIVKVESEQELWRRLALAVNKNSSILLLNWSNSWGERNYPGRFVEFPEYDDKCISDESWGVNPKHIYDCGPRKSDWVKKVVWQGMKEQWPCAYMTLKNSKLSSEMINKALPKFIETEEEFDQIALSWVRANRSIWSDWVPGECLIVGR